MMEQLSRVVRLTAAVNNISAQVIYEVEGLGFPVHKILMSFTKSDWEELRLQLCDWDSNQLEVLAFVLHDGDGFREVVENNFMLPYIFTLAEDSLASYLLSEVLIYFLTKRRLNQLSF